MNGLSYLLKERAFYQELFLGILLLTMEISKSFCLDLSASPIMRLYLFTSYIIVLITEALNTAIETVVNRISIEKNSLSKKAKDLGSAAVFLALIHLGIVWIASFIF